MEHLEEIETNYTYKYTETVGLKPSDGVHITKDFMHIMNKAIIEMIRHDMSRGRWSNMWGCLKNIIRIKKSYICTVTKQAVSEYKVINSWKNTIRHFILVQIIFDILKPEKKTIINVLYGMEYCRALVFDKEFATLYNIVINLMNAIKLITIQEEKKDGIAKKKNY